MDLTNLPDKRGLIRRSISFVILLILYLIYPKLIGFVVLVMFFSFLEVVFQLLTGLSKTLSTTNASSGRKEEET